MPGYPGNNLARLLYENRQGVMFWDEPVRAGGASVAFQLRRVSGVFQQPFACSFQLTFGAAPGTFAVDIQAADTDVDANYVTVTTLNSLSANGAARADFTNLWPLFVRGKVVSIGNAVTARLLVSLAGQGPTPSATGTQIIQVADEATAISESTANPNNFYFWV